MKSQQVRAKALADAEHEVGDEEVGIGEVIEQGDPSTESVVTFSIDMELDGGTKVSIAVTYPEGETIAGVMALVQAGKPKIINGLLHGMRKDKSVAKWMEDQHLGFDEDEDEDFEEDLYDYDDEDEDRG